LVETPKQRFSVAPAKMEKVKSSLRELVQAGHVSARQLAKVAGKIISISPAVLPAALYSRPFFAAMQGKLSWDNLFPTPESARNMAKRFLERLDEWNGRRWYPRTITVEAGSDASDTGVGGTIRIPGRPVRTVVATLSPTERGMSSTAREVVAFHQVLLETTRQAGEVLEGAAVLLSGDNHGEPSMPSGAEHPMSMRRCSGFSNCARQRILMSWRNGSRERRCRRRMTSARIETARSGG
jgi:hypothetical protein